MTTEVWSCGGGTQSAAIAALIIQGKLPKPDISLIVDTEREKSHTWHYLNNILSPALAQVGVTVEVVKKSRFATCDLYSVNGESLLIPAYSTQDDEGKLDNYCSGEWKREVTKRYLRKERGVESATVWFGISLDEMSRVRTPRQKWLQHRYPLIFDVPMSRQDCIGLVQEMGWPEPPRSSCWMCPNMRDHEWREMKADYPQDFQKAVELEQKLRERDKHIYLHESMKPLDEVDFTSTQTTFMDNGCDSGYCGH